MSRDTAAIRDQLGNDPDTSFYLNADYYEDVGIEELPAVLSKKTLGHAWIVGTSTNGIVGTNTGTEDGQQQTVGGGGRVETIHRIVCPNNIFHEHFRDNDFKDDQTTADWNTTLYRLAMTTETSKSKVYNTVATFSSIFLNEQTVHKATLSCTETKYGNDLIIYALSADGGVNWVECELDTEVAFSVPGTDLRLRIIFIGNGANETYIEEVRVKYEV